MKQKTQIDIAYIVFAAAPPQVPLESGGREISRATHAN
jgi:hypothetical protein